MFALTSQEPPICVYFCSIQLLVPQCICIFGLVLGLHLFTNLFSFHSYSPASSSRYGSSCNVSQGSSLLSELDQYHEQDDDRRERDSIHSSHSYCSLSKDGQAVLGEQEKTLEVTCESEKGKTDESKEVREDATTHPLPDLVLHKDHALGPQER